ncbi:Site-specific DNA-cytosine methylase [Nostoc flagelliforme CCNUN1]|uniref:Site-specific DNA-cytosine methylase n=1 Tax=Nostoc flagelliforme CCNUN1 TaxID=2038116 RepID=A0A2K8SYW2_9NOSO|nr:Site-specific DNA-cytosine methylase [Nostoc flagelliforme CCNUN1]
MYLIFFAGSVLLDLGFETSYFNIICVKDIFSQFMPVYCS